MQTILVANPKGGSGKTTLATNVAGWLAGRKQRVVLADLDPLRSASEWLARRPSDWRERSPDWPTTRYEEKAQAAGRPAIFLRFRRQVGR